jgi:hypothetical protein
MNYNTINTSGSLTSFLGDAMIPQGLEGLTSKNLCSSITHLTEFPLDLQSIVITENRARRNIIYKSLVITERGRKPKILLEYMIPIDERRVVNIQDIRLPELDFSNKVLGLINYL